VFVLLQYIAEKEQHSAKKIVDTLVGITGLIIIVFTIKNAIDSIGNIEFVDICVSFPLPILLSIIYMPVAYFFAIYARYELLFLRMSFKEPKNTIVRIKHRMKIVWLCKFSYKRITRFLYEYVPKMYTRMENVEFEKILEEFKNRQKVI